MPHPMIHIDTRQITDWPSFHAVFARDLGFPAFYGRNMNAWIDCMTSLDAPEHGMTTVHANPGGIVVLQLDHAGDFARRCPDIYLALLESAAFVNHRRIECGEQAVLALSFEREAATT